MRMLDISLNLHQGTTSYPGEPGPIIQALKSMAKGDTADVSLLTLTTHTGTHVDAPCHFIPGGITVDQIPVEALVGRAQVVELNTRGHIGAEQLEEAALPARVRRIRFKTHKGSLWEDPAFREDFTAISAGGARWLAERGFVLVGIDYLSVEPFGAPQDETHLILLGAGIVVVEGLDLRMVAPGEYTLVCLPLKISGGDGSPARALLIEPPLPQLG